MKYKKYIVFGFDNYYPSGGLSDIVRSHDSIEEARAETKNGDYDSYEIVDRDTWEVVN